MPKAITSRSRSSSPSEVVREAGRMPIARQDIDLSKEPREVIHLVNELIREYGDVRTTKRIDHLWNSSVNTRAKTIPRPQNCFILFRNDITAEYNPQKGDHNVGNSDKKRTGKNVPKSSKIAKERWAAIKRDNQHEYQFWIKLTEIAKLKHTLLYPNYKYSPVRNKEPRSNTGRKRKSSNNTNEQHIQDQGYKTPPASSLVSSTMPPKERQSSPPYHLSPTIIEQQIIPQQNIQNIAAQITPTSSLVSSTMPPKERRSSPPYYLSPTIMEQQIIPQQNLAAQITQQYLTSSSMMSAGQHQYIQTTPQQFINPSILLATSSGQQYLQYYQPRTSQHVTYAIVPPSTPQQLQQQIPQYISPGAIVSPSQPHSQQSSTVTRYNPIDDLFMLGINGLIDPALIQNDPYLSSFSSFGSFSSEDP
ncbi:26098_t:CDS:1 [Racocetra persica]|uniref:26098_t:CDS:1 n=1 Tax=Racocetra persica TaxID=160502 RepID=A0ACA9MUR6_9GLOM|nr:26098_t:CDS:1 [Racocetra persica]